MVPVDFANSKGPGTSSMVAEAGMNAMVDMLLQSIH